MNGARIDIPLEKFVITIEPPQNRLANMSVYIHRDGKVNLNGRLVSQINKEKILLSFTEGYRNLCIKADSEHPSSRKLPKSGALKVASVSEGLEKCGISFPAQYDCWHSVSLECWQGNLIENPIKPPVGKHPNLQKK